MDDILNGGGTDRTQTQNSKPKLPYCMYLWLAETNPSLTKSPSFNLSSIVPLHASIIKEGEIGDIYSLGEVVFNNISHLWRQFLG